IQDNLKEFLTKFYDLWLIELKKITLYNDIIADMKNVCVRFKNNLLDLDKVDDKLIGFVKNKIEKNYKQIVAKFQDMHDCGYRNEFENLQQLLTQYNQKTNLITKSLDYPELLYNLDLESKKLIDHFIEDWNKDKKQIGNSYHDNVTKVDTFINNKLLNNKSEFAALDVLITTIKTEIQKKFETIKTDWEPKTEEYKTNKKCSEHLKKANKLFTTIENDFTLKFFDRALKLQTLEGDLNNIIDEMEDIIKIKEEVKEEY
ncbi:18865_t:CDS:2, partial [Gigaspora margarita]